MTTSPYNIH